MYTGCFAVATVLFHLGEKPKRDSITRLFFKTFHVHFDLKIKQEAITFYMKVIRLEHLFALGVELCTSTIHTRCLVKVSSYKNKTSNETP